MTGEAGRWGGRESTVSIKKGARPHRLGTTQSRNCGKAMEKNFPVKHGTAQYSIVVSHDSTLSLPRCKQSHARPLVLLHGKAEDDQA